MASWDSAPQTASQGWGNEASSGGGGMAFAWGEPSEAPAPSAGWGSGGSTAQNDDWGAIAQKMEAVSIREDRPRREAVPDSGPQRFEIEESTVSLEDIWPNFKEADASRDLDDIKPALAEICGCFQGKSWQDLEKKFRDTGCNTYLVALEDPVSFGYTLVNLKGESNQRFRVIPSLIKPGTTKTGRLSIGKASSYEENFERLNEAGVVRPSGVPKCHNCKEEGHISSDCPEEKREPEKSEYFGKCYNCSSQDHRTRNCPEPRKVIACKNCQKQGHIARDCPDPPTPMICNRCNEEGHSSRDCDQSRTDITCNRCQQPGHMSRDCDQPRTDITCNRCQQPGHMARDCDQPRTDITCNRCQQPGHMSRDCDQPRTDMVCKRCNEPGHFASDCSQPRTDITCYNCDQVGHASRDCPEPRRPREAGADRGERRPRTSRFGFSQGF